jgi:hypothetical protein
LLRRFAPLFPVLLAFLLAATPAAAQEEANWDEQFRSQMTEWIKTIATRDPQFQQWQDATAEVQTLGANQHQWLVSLHRSGQQVGYLVIGEAPDPGKKKRFVLLEYGVGEFILFDDAFAPREIAAEPVYDGFSSHWLVAGKHSKRMVNAKTGEAYPEAFQASAPVMDRLPAETLISFDGQLSETRILESTEQNPFDHIGWFHELNVNTGVTWDQLWQQPAEEVRVTLTVPLHRGQVLAPFVVGTLHLWNDSRPYVGVWDEGLRFLPFSYVEQVGTFHVNKTSSPSE